MVPSNVLGGKRPKLLILDMVNTELVLWRWMLRWLVIGIGWCWVGMVAGLQRGWVTEVYCQVWLSSWVVNAGCYTRVVT